MYAICDIETTGAASQGAKITEIAIFVFDGEKIVDEFVSLINPGIPIPSIIVGITGITDDMVANAPQFHEVAKRIVEITDGKIFVAHNVDFDYNFIRHEYKMLGYNYVRDKLCTVKLSRKIIPGYPSYSLGNLCRSLNIEIKGRHRAAGDALATTKLFELLLQNDRKTIYELSKGEMEGLIFPDNLSKEKIKTLPEDCGVYYFYNDSKELIYIGKSKNIRQRVLSHFNNKNSTKAEKMRMQIADIDFELTGSELIALLKESEEIKLNQPVFNRSQKKYSYYFSLLNEYDANGFLTLRAEKLKNGVPSFGAYSSMEEAKRALRKLVEKFFLCEKICGLESSDGSCFKYKLHQCRGACCGKETAEDYNKRVATALRSFDFKDTNLLILDKGRKPNEKSVVLIEDTKYKGYGFADMETVGHDLELLKESVMSFKDNRDAPRIIKGFLHKHKVWRKIRF